MKNILRLLLCGGLLFGFNACQDEVDVEEKLNFPPTLFSVYPKTSVKSGNDFDVKVIFVDGAGSPLSSATVTLKNESGTEVFAVTKAIAGLKDSVIVTGEDFDATALPLGIYTLAIKATDSRNNELTATSTFKVADQLYAANQAHMYVAGAYNGWGSDEMELIADNTWQIKGIDLDGEAWKLKNTTDWSDKDWGDDDCDKTMVSGNGDIKCGYSGLINLTFNDETLAYTIVPAVEYDTELASLYLLGSMNDYEGDEPAFTLVADYTWEIAEVRLKAGDKFRFSELPGFGGAVYGAGSTDGKAEKNSANNIKMASDAADAYYKLSFNEQTLQYTLSVVRYPYPAALYLVGGSTSIGWSETSAIPFTKTSDGKFEIYAYLKVIADGNGFKFLQEKGWNGDWGKSKTADGTLEQNTEDNITVASDGFYRILVDFTTLTYSATKTQWGIVGSARTGDDTGWNADDDMTFDGDWDSYTWTITKALKTGELKFRANDGWDINYGDAGADKILDFNSSVNIAIPADNTYTITLTFDPVNGYKYTITP